jgi:hypothetical protein
MRRMWGAHCRRACSRQKNAQMRHSSGRPGNAGLLTLRRLQRESPESPFLFVSERGAPFTPQPASQSLWSALARRLGWHSNATRTCSATPAAMRWPTRATTPGPCKPTSAIAASRTQSESWRRLGSRTSGGSPRAPVQVSQGRVPLKMDGGIFVVPVQINGTMTLDFVIDSGATDVSIPADVVSTLIRAGTITEPDFIGESTYVLADGSATKSPTFTIRTLKVGNTVLKNVKGSVASTQGSLQDWARAAIRLAIAALARASPA